MSAINWARVDEGSHQQTDQLMELVVHPTNMGRAYRQVVGNKGSAEVDGMTVAKLLSHLRTNWNRQNRHYYQMPTIPNPGIYFAKLGLVNLTHALARSSR